MYFLHLLKRLYESFNWDDESFQLFVLLLYDFCPPFKVTTCEIYLMSRGGADQRLTSHVHEIVGRINGRYGSVTYTPIHHLASFYTYT